jgi:TolB-like protein
MRRIAFLFLIGLLFTVLANVAFSEENGLVEAINELADRLAFANEGYVRSVSGDTVYIDLAQDSGIFEAMRFEVVRLGEAIVSEGVIIGHQEEIIGEIEITRVRAQMSIASIINKSKEIVEGDKVYQLTKRIERIAITEFPYGERFNNLSKDIEDRFYTAMIQRGMQIVERDRLTEILAEQAMEWTGLFDLSSAAELGRLLGVEGVLIGSITDQGEILSIRARLVDVETAQALTAAETSVNKTPTVMEALGSGIRGKPSVIQVQREANGEPAPAGHFVFSDDFSLKPDNRWDLADGQWTVLDGRFTPLEVKTGKWYSSSIDIGKLRNYVIEVDVYLGDVYAYSGAWAEIGARVSSEHGVWFQLKGRRFGLYGTRLQIGDFLVGEREMDIDNPIHMRIEVRDGLYAAYINGDKVVESFDTQYRENEAAKVSLEVFYRYDVRDARTTFDNFRIEEIP